MEFSDKIIETILANLDDVNLRKMLNIKRFRSVILNSRKLMRRLPLILSGDEWHSKLKFIQNHGSQIVNVDIKSTVWVRTSKELIDVLKLTPNLEKLYVSASVECDFSDSEATEDIVRTGAKFLYDDDDDEIHDAINSVETDESTNKNNLAEFTNLEYLRLCCTKELIKPFLKFLWNCDNLKDFRFEWNDQIVLKIYLEFILKQKQLKSLELYGPIYSLFKVNLSLDIVTNVKFRLKKLVLCNNMSGYSKILYEFLKTQTEVEDLTWPYNSVNYKYFQLVFKTYKKLKKMNMEMSMLEGVDDKLFAENFVINSLEELFIDGENVETSTLEKFIKFVPNVKHIEMIMTNIHYKALENLKQLEKLTIRLLRSDCLIFVNMENLKHLQIDYLSKCCSPETWHYITSCCPNIEVLVISDGGQFQNILSAQADASAITRSLGNLKKLKTFSLYFLFDQSRFDEFLQQEREEQILILVSINCDTINNQTKLTVSTYFANECVEDFLYLHQLYENCDVSYV